MKSLSLFKPALGAILILGCAIMTLGCAEDAPPAVSPDDITPSTDIPDPEPEPSQ